MKLVHLLAKTYGCLPSDLMWLLWEEYQFNAAVLLASVEDEDGGPPGAGGPVSFNWDDLAG